MLIAISITILHCISWEHKIHRFDIYNFQKDLCFVDNNINNKSKPRNLLISGQTHGPLSLFIIHSELISHDIFIGEQRCF